MSGGFFRGTSADQDTRFSNKQAKLLKSQKFHPELEHLVNITKVKMDVMKPWIAKRVTELLGFEDEVLINFIYGLLDGKEVNGKEIQISLTGFMEKSTGKFMKELWQLLLSAQNNASGVPQQFLDAKEEETKNKQAESDRISGEMQKKKKEDGEFEEEKKKKMDGEFGMTEPRSKRQLEASDDKEISTRNGARGRSRVSKSPHSPGDASLSPWERRKSRSPPPRGRSISSERAHHSRPRRSISPHRKYSPLVSLSPPIRRSPHLRRRSPSPSSPIWRRMRSPVTYRSRSPIRRRSRTPVRHRCRSPTRYRSRSPVRRRYLSPRRRSPSPVRRRYHRSPSTPPPRSQSPIRLRSPFRNRRSSPVPARYRSHSREASSSPSPVPRDKRSPIRQRSPVRSPREKSRASGEFYPARHARSGSSDESSDENRGRRGSEVHRPFVSLRSPQRDSRALENARRKPKSPTPSPQRSHIQSKLPKDSGRQSSYEDKRSYSPYKSLVMQSKEPNVRDIKAIPLQNPRDRIPRRDSPEDTTKKGEFDRVRDNGNQELNSSERSTTLSKPDTRKDSEKAYSKYNHSPESPIGPRYSETGETRDQSDGLELRKKGPDNRSEKTSRKVLPPEDSDKGKVQKADEKTQPFSHETKHSKQVLEMEKTAELDDKDGSGSMSSGSDDSYKRHKRKSRKHRRFGRKEVTSDDSSGSETEDRKEAKRRKKEERRARKEERRQRREERHRRREERRAEKLKAKSNDSRAAEETISEQKRLEIELREKALESLRAKKGAGY